MGYSLMNKINWTYFADTLLKAFNTVDRNSYMTNLAGSTTTVLPGNFHSVSIMNTHGSNTISVTNGTDTVTVPALTTINFDAGGSGNKIGGTLTVTTGSGTAIVVGVR